MSTINRVASVEEVKGIRNKERYDLIWSRHNPDRTEAGCIEYTKLDRKVIKAQIAVWAKQMQVGDDLDLYVVFSKYDYEQLMTLTMQESGLKVIVDGDPQKLEWADYKF